MQALIQMTSLLRLHPNLRISGVELGDPAQLVQDVDDEIAVDVMLASRLPFGLGKSKIVRAGYLSDQAKTLIMPAIEKDAALRVRIVDIRAAHLHSDGDNQLSISVWGDPADIIPTAPLGRIFSRSRINDGPCAK